MSTLVAFILIYVLVGVSYLFLWGIILSVIIYTSMKNCDWLLVKNDNKDKLF